MSALQASLADRINEQHALAFGKAREALEHARQAGSLLLEAKATLAHGEWLPWLSVNVKFSPRTAQAYIRLAENWDALQAKSATAAHLTLREALQAIAGPPSKAPEVDQRVRTLAGRPLSEREMGYVLQGELRDYLAAIKAQLTAEQLTAAEAEWYEPLPGPVRVTPTSLELPDGLKFGQWLRIGEMLSGAGK